MPNPLKITFDLNPGPFYGQPIAPSGWEDEGPFCINYADSSQPLGSWWSIADVAADGTVTLHQPEPGWQLTSLGQKITNPSPATAPATPTLAAAATAAASAGLALTPPVAPQTNPGHAPLVPTAADVAKFGIFALPTVPAGSPGAAS